MTQRNVTPLLDTALFGIGALVLLHAAGVLPAILSASLPAWLLLTLLVVLGAVRAHLARAQSEGPGLDQVFLRIRERQRERTENTVPAPWLVLALARFDRG